MQYGHRDSMKCNMVTEVACNALCCMATRRAILHGHTTRYVAWSHDALCCCHSKKCAPALNTWQRRVVFFGGYSIVRKSASVYLPDGEMEDPLKQSTLSVPVV